MEQIKIKEIKSSCRNNVKDNMLEFLRKNPNIEVITSLFIGWDIIVYYKEVSATNSKANKK